MIAFPNIFLVFFVIIRVRNYISYFSVMLPFLAMALSYLLGLSAWLQIIFT